MHVVIVLLAPHAYLFRPIDDLLTAAGTFWIMHALRRQRRFLLARRVIWKLLIVGSLINTLYQTIIAAADQWITATVYQFAWLLVFAYLLRPSYDQVWAWAEHYGILIHNYLFARVPDDGRRDWRLTVHFEDGGRAGVNVCNATRRQCDSHKRSWQQNPFVASVDVEEGRWDPIWYVPS